MSKDVTCVLSALEGIDLLHGHDILLLIQDLSQGAEKRNI